MSELPEGVCISKPLFHGSQFWEFSCGSGAFIEGEAPSLGICPFCYRPLNTVVRKTSETEHTDE